MSEMVRVEVEVDAEKVLGELSTKDVVRIIGINELLTYIDNDEIVQNISVLRWRKILDEIGLDFIKDYFGLVEPGNLRDLVAYYEKNSPKGEP